MEKANEKYALSGLALLSGLIYLGIPGVLLMSDFEEGGVSRVLEVVQAPEYDEIRLIAFYAPIVALILFSIFAGSILTKSKASIISAVLCGAFSLWALFEINTIGLLGLLVSVGYLYNVFLNYKQERT